MKFDSNFIPGNTPKEVLRIASPPGQPNTLRPICKYNGKLYAGTSNNTIYESALPVEQPASGWPFNTSTVGWNIIATDADFGLAWQNYKYICWEFREYAGYLYVIIGSIEPDNHTRKGFLMFRGKHNPDSPNANQAGWVWEEIIGDNGFYPPGMGSSSQGVASMTVFNDYLYVGTSTDVLGPLVTQGPDSVIRNVRPPRIFRFDQNLNCQMIIGDTNSESQYDFLWTRLGNYGSGFYNRSIAQLFFPEPFDEFNYSLNQYMWWMEVYNGKLYCATFDIRIFLKYFNDETLITFGIENPAVRAQILEAIEMLMQANTNPAGFDIYFTSDGINWEPLTRDGFGDQFNYGGRVMKATRSEMYVGTANPFYGCQVWKVYEPSGSGGGSNCFIATVAFGSPLAKQVQILREFRDRFLLTNRSGKKFVDWYYLHGPGWAQAIEKQPFLKSVMRIVLYPVIAICWLIVNGILPYLTLVFSVSILYRKTKLHSQGT